MLASRPAGRTNFGIEGDEHRLLLEDYPLRLRAVAGGHTVLDTLRAKLLHETGRQVVPYVPLEDFDQSLLRRSEKRSPCPVKGEASYWSLAVGERTVPDAVWAYDAPLRSAAWLSGLAALRWDLAEAWYVEDEIVFGPHLRDPYHRVDVFETSRPVAVRVGEAVIARTQRAKLLFETSLPVRVYLPSADVAPGLLVESQTRTQCPYKGGASYYSLVVGGRRIDDAAWMYATPLPEAIRIAGHVCFLAEGVEVELAELPARGSAQG